MENAKGRECVTGATGFIGSWIIKSLLEDGYSLNAIIKSNPEQKGDVSFLTNLPGASENLQIVSADLSNPESLEKALEGCTGVFYVPIDSENKEAEEVVTKRAIDEALGLLKACLSSKTVKRVVYTSSGVAVTFNGKELEEMDESLWSDVEFLRTVKPPSWSYAVSKTMTEKAVLEFGETNGLDVVTLLPPMVVGPFICPRLPYSIYSSLYFAFDDDKNSFRYVQIPMAHVDDIARAHIFLLEHPNAKGRYNCTECLATIEKIHKLLSVKYPEIQIPKLEVLKEMKGLKLPNFSSKKLIDAGFEFKYGLEEMFVDAIKSCKEKGFL